MKMGTLSERRPVRPRLEMDYPQEGEVIASPSYTFRIDGDAPCVEIAIDGGDWSPCRRCDGYWWFDWAGYDSGRHQAMIRGASSAGQAAVTRCCRFLVLLPTQ